MQPKRRNFLTNAGAGLMAGSGAMLAAPAVHAQGAAVKWRCATSFPKSLDVLFGDVEMVAEKVKQITNGRFIIEVNEAGKLAPALGVLDPVSKGEFECSHTAPYYFFAKDPTFALDCAIPFGMSTRGMNAWYQDGTGYKLMREFYNKFNIVNIPCGQTGTQMGGWFKKEIKSVEDLKGVKMRIAGLAGRIMSSFGVFPTQVAAAESVSSLESGKLDAVEWVGPHDDEKLGFYKVAPYYYYPGWWEGSAQISLLTNTQAHAKLPEDFKAALDVACAYAQTVQQARYDTRNSAALRRLVANGAKLRAMPQPIMDLAFRETQKVYAELIASNASWAKIYPDYLKFQKEMVAWFRYSENAYDNFASRLFVR